MTYVYRDTARLRRHPAVVVPTTLAAPAPPDPMPERPPELPNPKLPVPTKPLAPKKEPKPLPPPIWGGRLGLELAYFEVDDWERRHPKSQPTERRTP